MAQGTPTSLKQLLPALLGKLASSGSASALAPVWAELAGPQLARHTRPISLIDGVLVIEAASAGWAREVQSQQAELQARLGEQLGAAAVTRLECRVRG